MKIAPSMPKVPFQTARKFVTDSALPTAKTSTCCCGSAAKRTATAPGPSHEHTADVADEDATVHPDVSQALLVSFQRRHAGSATTAGHANVIACPSKPAPHTNCCWPNAAPQ